MRTAKNEKRSWSKKDHPAYMRALEINHYLFSMSNEDHVKVIRSYKGVKHIHRCIGRRSVSAGEIVRVIHKILVLEGYDVNTNSIIKEKELKMTTHEQIVENFNNYMAEHAKFEEKGVKASAARARKALGELGKLAKDRRKEIQEKKNAM